MLSTARARASTLLAGLAVVLAPGTAGAEALGQPRAWEMGLQPQVTDIGEWVNELHNALLVIITLITLFVAALIVYVLVRFRETRNPVPARTTHNTLLEIAWTIVPVMILVGIAVPSFRLLKYKLVPPPPDITIKATASQWLWTYEYPKNQGGGFSFISKMLDEKDRAARIAAGTPADDAPRLLAVDNEVVLPVGKIIVVQVTSTDVIHGFNMPSFGVKVNAIPGRMNEVWFRVDKEGLYYGQCTQICGDQHSEMPLAFHIVSPDAYTAWLARAKKQFSSGGAKGERVADARLVSP